jgi:hypothetical protein
MNQTESGIMYTDIHSNEWNLIQSSPEILNYAVIPSINRIDAWLFLLKASRRPSRLKGLSPMRLHVAAA